jgi:NADH-quinone oxidoreductase subunit E
VVAAIEKEAAKYPTPLAAVKSALRYAQEEHGWISEDVATAVARAIGVEPIRVWEVATFYDLFHTEPVGRHVLRVCTNISCLLRESDGVMEHISARLGIGHGETTADGRFTLLEVECLGACCNAPMMMVGNRYHLDLTAAKIDSILDELE